MDKISRDEIIRISLDLFEIAGGPVTVRQIFYHLVAAHGMSNLFKEYKRVISATVIGRQREIIPWDAIEDRSRRPWTVPMWSGLEDYASSVIESYRRDLWEFQDHYVEVWLEKEALSGIFVDILETKGVTLSVGHGNPSYPQIKEIADRFRQYARPVLIFFSDFDPTGVDLRRDVKERLALWFDCKPKIIIGGLKKSDIKRYSLPSDVAKKSDSRTAKFIKDHGEDVVELDALPVQVLRTRIVQLIERYLDSEGIEKASILEQKERSKIRRLFT